MRAWLIGMAAVAAALAGGVAVASAQVFHWGDGLEAPAEVPGTASAKHIDAGNASGYALTGSGTVLAWGRGAFGALGDGSVKNSSTALGVHLPVGVQAVSLGEAERSGFAVTSTGHVFAWGMDKHGDLCLGPEQEEATVSRPQEIPGLTGAVAVQGAKNHVLILLSNGTVDTCGWGPEGQLGLGKGVKEVTRPRPVPGLERIVQVSAGPTVSDARTASGEVFVFGSNREGQAGLGAEVKRVYEPTRLPLPGAASSISVGGADPMAHTMALVEGVPYCWGNDEEGECGDGSEESKLTPAVATALTGLGPLAAVVATGATTMALTEGGDLYSVGFEQELGVPGGGSPFMAQFVEGGVVEISGTAQNHLDRH